jgi:hypothetical protein
MLVTIQPYILVHLYILSHKLYKYTSFIKLGLKKIQKRGIRTCKEQITMHRREPEEHVTTEKKKNKIKYVDISHITCQLYKRGITTRQLQGYVSETSGIWPNVLPVMFRPKLVALPEEVCRRFDACSGFSQQPAETNLGRGGGEK